MKARVKATGEIVEVKEEYDLRNSWVEVFYSNEEDPYEVYEKEELDFNVNDNMKPIIDYWTRLEHQAAIAAMQGVLANADLLFSLCKDRGITPVKVVAIEFANSCAHALVEKYKEKEESK